MKTDNQNEDIFAIFYKKGNFIHFQTSDEEVMGIFKTVKKYKMYPCCILYAVGR